MILGNLFVCRGIGQRRSLTGGQDLAANKESVVFGSFKSIAQDETYKFKEPINQHLQWICLWLV